ncbi:MAG: hypothetical protein L0Z07_00595 [Planctomycetes bacterium]|nr:hypothetical protein [Planctomycetota bacterium]
MEARFGRVVPAMTLLAILVQLSVELSLTHAAGRKTANFEVSAPTPQLAQEIGDAAEAWRKQLAIEWLGRELPPWSKSCPIHARVAPKLGAGGATSFIFDHGEVFGWKMNIQGSRERILDSVLPHEITHTIFASHFRQPLPRWADEGACTTVEHRSEIVKQERMLIDFLKTGRGIPFSQMFAMKEYPNDVMPLYSQGHSLAQWLIEGHGRTAYLEFLADGMQDENWPRAVQRRYGFENLYAMQNAWLDWVKQGRPRLAPDVLPAGQLASNTQPGIPGTVDPASQAIYRGQSPDDITPIKAVPVSQPSVVAGGPEQSIYATVAARAEQQRAASKRPAASISAATSGTSVYDASINTGVLRR